MAGPDPLGRLVGAVVPRAVESIDLNEVMTEVDVNALLDRIDLDRLLERVDVDRLLERVDVEQLIHRVDIEEIIRRAQVDAIVGATASTFSHRMLDGIRRQLVGFDIITTRLVDRVAHRHIDVPVEDNGSFTGQRAGGATRLTAFLVDVLTVSVLFTAAVSLLLFLASLFIGHHIEVTRGIWFALGYATLALVYQWSTLVVAGRSLGKALVGLRVTAPDLGPIGVTAATKRVLVYPFSFILGLGLVGIVIGRHHQALHDLAAPSAVRYDWGDRPAEMPAPLTRFLTTRCAYPPGSGSANRVGTNGPGRVRRTGPGLPPEPDAA